MKSTGIVRRIEACVIIGRQNMIFGRFLYIAKAR